MYVCILYILVNSSIHIYKDIKKIWIDLVGINNNQALKECLKTPLILLENSVKTA